MRIGTDPAQAEHAIRQLDQLTGAIAHRAVLPPPPPLALMPHQTALIGARLAGESVQIGVLAVRTNGVTGDLARTTVAIMVASGDLNNPHLATIASYAASPAAKVAGDAVGDALSFVNDAWSATAGGTLALIYAHGKTTGWLLGELGKDAAAVGKSLGRELDAFGKKFDEALGKAAAKYRGGTAALRSLRVLGIGLQFIDSFQKGVGDRWSKGLTSLVSTGLTANPVGGAIEFFTGGLVTGSVNAITSAGVLGLALATGETEVADLIADEFTKKAEDGTFGWVMQPVAAVGDGIADFVVNGNTDSFDQRAGNGDFGWGVETLRTGVNWTVDGLYDLSPWK